MQNQKKINLLEILQGYSVLGDGPDRFYFKHPTILDRLSESFLHQELEKRGRKIGLLNEEELLEEAISCGKYSREYELEKEDLEWALGKKKKLASKFQDEALLKANEESMKKDSERIKEINEIRNSFIKSSLETFVSSKSCIYSCKNFCFLDKGLSTKVDEERIGEYIIQYLNKYNTLVELDSVLETCYLPDFFELVRLSDDPLFVFGENSKNITLFQRDLLVCAKILKQKIDNIDNIQKKILNDAVLLYHYIPSANQEAKETNIRDLVEEKGGLKNMTPSDKLT
jgi:hypothetical protein